MKHWIVAAALCTAGPALAGEACDAPKNDFDGLYCLNKIYQEADQELNANFRTLMPLLDSSGKAQLRSGQMAWIETRNAECSRHEADKFLVDLRCATETTIKRSQFLQDRIRECKSSGCLNSRL